MKVRQSKNLMSQTVPSWLQPRLGPARPGHAGLAIAKLASEKDFGRGGFAITSPAFREGEELDPCFTADEEDAVAPPLEWSAPPPGAQELVLVVEDADNAAPNPFCHWLVWGLAPQRGKLLEGEVPPRVGKNAHGNSEWLLPEVEFGDPAHQYVFQLFAIDLPLTIMPGAKREDLMASLEGHIVASALLTGTYAGEEQDEDGEWDEDI